MTLSGALSVIVINDTEWSTTPMKPGFPATDLLASLLKTSLDSHASFTCETGAKQSDSFEKLLETCWWKILFALKFEGDKVQENL